MDRYMQSTTVTRRRTTSMFPVTLWFRSGDGERKSLRNFVILPISNTVLYSEDSSGFSLLALSTMDAYTRNKNGSQWIRQNRVISSWKFCPLRGLLFYVTLGNNITLLCHSPGKLTQGQYFVSRYLPGNTKSWFRFIWFLLSSVIRWGTERFKLR